MNCQTSMTETAVLNALSAAGVPMADAHRSPAKAKKPVDPLKALRLEMYATKELPAAKLRVLADAKDGLAAFRYAQMLEISGAGDVQGDAAQYYTVALFTGRDFAVGRLVKLLKAGVLNAQPSRLQAARDALELRAKAGNDKAALALADMLIAGQPFGQDPVAARRWLQIATDRQNGEAALKLAFSYLAPAAGQPANAQAARDALKIAAGLDIPGTQATAKTLLAQLGPPAIRPQPRPGPRPGIVQGKTP